MADTLNISELKNLKLLAIKQKMLDLGFDAKGSKAELLVKLKKHLKVRKADLGCMPPCVPGFAARPALAKSPVTGTKCPTSMTNSKVTTTCLKTNLCICPICDDLIEERSETTPGHDAVEDSLSSNLVSSPVPPPSIEVLSVKIRS